MSAISEQQTPLSFALRAAENGLVLSGCICALLLCCGSASAFPPAALLLWAGSLAMPFVAYRLLARSYRRSLCSMSFAELWAEGIASFFLGSLVPALVAYVLLRFAFPDFIAGQIDATIDAFNALGTPDGDRWAQMLTDIRAKAPMPKPVDIAANLISFNIVVGTILTLFVIPFVKLRNRMPGCADGKNIN